VTLLRTKEEITCFDRFVSRDPDSAFGAVYERNALLRVILMSDILFGVLEQPRETDHSGYLFAVPYGRESRQYPND